ncbi:hypothetical protein QJS10_CPB14g01562 [Acorus calamus]|uniref:E3 ubiquitin-protein ligase n=1 Tax=Acorus calamus TaxID=4465 RepID=A0AAV9DE09_ACOCL|nr:hypothetical protein QJS10_CPB14g01562 [Acorus calamus]
MNPSVSAPDFDRLSPRDRIIHKLDRLGVPKAALEQSQNGLVAFVKKNKSMIPEIVSAIFPSSEEERHSTSPEKGTLHSLIVDLYIESLLWIQWLMFEADPQTTLEDLERIGAGQRAVCGSVWGEKDLAYRCRTCENDSTCAICVPCFQNGDHKDHDYSMMYTGGGCCDCGDVTAWKREGFCSAHKGAEQIQPLPEEIADSMGPVLDALLVFWTGRLSDAGSRGGNEWVVDLICYPVVDMLIKFCNLSESLLSFIAKRMIPLEGVLDVLMRAETFLQKPVAQRLHEFFLKLLGEPVFKYEFAKVFVRYYPHVIDEASQRGGDFADQKFLLLPSFSVQLFTVPTLVVRLVREVDLLNILLGCLRRLFLSRAGEGGVLEIGRFADIYENTVRVVEDIRYVMSHAEVSKHVVRDRPEIYRTWMELLSMVQGMGHQRE